MSLIHLTLLIFFFYMRCEVEIQFPFFAPLSRTVYCLMQLLPNDLQCHLFMQQASCICVCFSIFFYLLLYNRKSCSISGAIPEGNQSICGRLEDCMCFYVFPSNRKVFLPPREIVLLCDCIVQTQRDPDLELLILNGFQGDLKHPVALAERSARGVLMMMWRGRVRWIHSAACFCQGIRYCCAAVWVDQLTSSWVPKRQGLE